MIVGRLDRIRKDFIDCVRVGTRPPHIKNPGNTKRPSNLGELVTFIYNKHNYGYENVRLNKLMEFKINENFYINRKSYKYKKLGNNRILLRSKKPTTLGYDAFIIDTKTKLIYFENIPARCFSIIYKIADYFFFE